MNGICSKRQWCGFPWELELGGLGNVVARLPMDRNAWGLAGCGNGLAPWRAGVKTQPRLCRGWGQAAIYISFRAVKQLGVHSCVYFQNLSVISVSSFHPQYLSAPGDFLPVGNRPCRRRRGKCRALRVGSDGLCSSFSPQPAARQLLSLLGPQGFELGASLAPQA